MYTQLKTKLAENGILTITIDRPQAMNALNIQLLKELEQVVQDVYDNEAIKAVLLTGEGEKAFAAGADITELQSLNEITARKFAERGQELFASIENCPKPFLAAINGFALGGGCELAMACHMRGATENAKLGQPEINLGILPGYGGTQRLTLLVGKAKSLELQLTGDHISAQEAIRLGLLNFIEPDKASLISKCEFLLQKIISKAPFATEMIINAVNAVHAKDQDGYQLEANAFARCTSTADFKEGVSAFLEKRKPHFTGR